MPTSGLERTAVEPGKHLSLALTICMHILLALFLFYGVRWQTHTPEAVQVELVRAVPQPLTSAPPEEAVAPPLPPPPKVEPKPEPRPEPKAQPLAKPLPKPDIAIKEKLKPAPKPEPKPEPKTEPKPDPFKEQLRREAERLGRDKLADTAAKELAEVKAAQTAASNGKLIAAWIARIRDKIRGNIVLPPDVKGNPEAVFMVTQLPTGQIIDVSLVKSSGHAALDSAIERAIRKSDPLPKSDKSDMFERELKLSFRPLEN